MELEVEGVQLAGKKLRVSMLNDRRRNACWKPTICDGLDMMSSEIQ